MTPTIVEKGVKLFFSCMINLAKNATDCLTIQKFTGINNGLKPCNSIVSVHAILIPSSGEKAVDLAKQVIFHPADTDSFCGSIIFTKLPQIYFH